MNDDITRVLETLLSAFASPVLGQVQDRNLQSAITAVKQASLFLATEITAAPAFRLQALQQYAAMTREIETLFRQHGLTLDNITQLAQLAASNDSDSFEPAVDVAKQVFLQWQGIKDADPALVRKFIAVESDYAARIWAARTKSTEATIGKPVEGGGEATVIQSRSYDEGKLEAFIAATFPDERDVKLAGSSFISGGSSKYTLSLRLANTTSLPEQIILRGDSTSSSGFGGVPVKSEYDLLRVLHQHGVCVPEPLAYEGSGEVFGSPFMLVERRPGVIIGHMFQMPAPDKQVCRDVATRLAQIHAVPLDALKVVRGSDRGTIDQIKDFLGESLTNWRATGRCSPIYEAAFDWLQRNIGILERTRRLVHGDYGLNNILIDNRRVSVILDWEFAHIGNPAYDLGYFHYQAESLDSWEAFVQAYRDAGGAPISDAELDYSILFSVVRLGVMVCQTEVVYRNGQIPGLGGANATMNHMHETSINRISRLLQRLL